MKQLIREAGKPCSLITTPTLEVSHSHCCLSPKLPAPFGVLQTTNRWIALEKKQTNHFSLQWTRRLDYTLSDTQQVVIDAFFNPCTFLLNFFPGTKALNSKDSTSVKTGFDVFSNRFQNNDIALIASCSKVKFPSDSVPSFLPWNLKTSTYLFTSTILHKMYTLPD